ncbi:MAG: glycosyltransferase family 2 protein [Candidatus Omnitrophica bacterium]|nr:glycosyltransferase family 2 protein [Candidatus Omnitrophota bacterium]
MRKMTVFVVVSVFNEAPVLRGVIEELLSLYPHVVVVDDGSTDESLKTVEGLPIFTLRHLVNRGQGAALQTGIAFAMEKGAALLVTFDGDGQHDPRDIEKLLTPIRSGEAEVSLGSRFLEKGSRLPLFRRLLLQGGILFTRLSTGLPITDTHNGLRAFSREAASKINFTMDRMAHASELFEILQKEKLRYREVPVTIRYTSYSLHKGQSTWDLFRILGSLLERSFLK